MSFTRLLRPRRIVVLALAGALVALAAGPSPGASLPDSHTQPLADGCQRSDAMQLALATPEWTYVNRAQVLAARAAGDATAGNKTVVGTVLGMHPAGDDLYINHDYNDIDIDVAPDAAHADLAATGNGGHELGLEWEATHIPVWAWPQPGDGIRASGSWIWDCGHWGNGPADEDTGGVSELLPYDPEETAKDVASPGAIAGESTELHPLYEVATFRKDAADVIAGRASQVSKLDVWISGEGSPAFAEEECALKGIPPSAARAACSQSHDVGGDYSYTLDVGNATTGAIVTSYTFHDESKTTPQDFAVTQNPDGHTVTVSFSLPHDQAPQHFGVTVEAARTDAPAAVHHVVTVNQLAIRYSLDGSTEPSQNPFANGPEQTPDPGEWVLYAAANGHWTQLHGVDLQTGAPITDIAVPTGGITLTMPAAFDYYLPQNVAPTFYLSGRECDIPFMDCMHEQYGAAGLGADTPFHEAGFNDHPGRIRDGEGGVSLSNPVQTFSPNVSPKGQPNENDSDYTCLGGCYSVTVTSS